MPLALMNDKEQQEAQEMLDFFAQKFGRWHGVGHLILARHAAFPIAVTPDLLYQLWANFKLYKDEQGNDQLINMLAVSDLLLSSLFRETGNGMYEMSAPVRALLLQQLENDARFGEERLQQLASFLYQYIAEQPDKPEWKNFKDAQKWTAVLAVDPLLAANNIIQSLVNQVNNVQVGSSIGAANLIGALAKSSEDFARVVADRLEEREAAKDVIGSGKTLVLAEGAAAGSVSVNLPAHISAKLKGVKAGVARQVQEENALASKVYGVVVGVNKFNSTSTEAVKRAQTFIDAIRRMDSISIAQLSMLLDKHETFDRMREAMRAALEQATDNDFVLVYYTGSGMNAVDQSWIEFSADYKGTTVPGDRWRDIDFNEFVKSNIKNNPTVILILDAASGSRNWLDENNPKHILLMASHLTEYRAWNEDAGIFTDAFIKSLRMIGNTTYRNLYSEIVSNIIHVKQDPSLVHLPVFSMSHSNWNTRFLSHRPISQVLQTQMLLRSCGYEVKEDGRTNIETTTAIQQFLSDHNLGIDEDIVHYLKFKEGIRRKRHIYIMLLYSLDVTHEIVSVFQDTVFTVQRHSMQTVPDQQDKNELLMKIRECDCIIFGISNLSLDPQRLPLTECIFDLAFALDKNILIYSEEPLNNPGALGRYQPIIWNFIEANIVVHAERVKERMREYRDFLKKMLTVNARRLTLDSTLNSALHDALTSRKLHLPNEGLDEIPIQVFQLRELEELHLEGNNISVIPPEIGELTELRVLNLAGNPFTSLPLQLFELTKLETLILSNSELEEIPEDIHKLSALRNLALHSTNLCVLQESIAYIPELEILDVRETKILNIPPHILRGHNAVAKFKNYVHSQKGPVRDESVLLVAETEVEINKLMASLRKEGDAITTLFYGINFTDLPAVYSLLRDAADCVIYIDDRYGRLIKMFDNNQSKLRIFFREAVIHRNNFIYAGPEKALGWLTSLSNIPLLNCVITFNSNKNGHAFAAELLKEYFAGKGISESVNLAKQKWNVEFNMLPGSDFVDTKLARKNMLLKATEVGQVKRLTTEAQSTNELNLSGLNLREIPSEVFSLVNLRRLEISDNPITAISPSISKLQNLETLIASRTSIKTLPPEIGRLKNLTSLIIDESPLAYFPFEIGELNRLNQVSFSRTNVKVIPRELFRANLGYISAHENNIINVSPEMLGSGRISSLKQLFHYRTQRSAKTSIVVARLTSKFVGFSSTLEMLLRRNAISDTKYIYKPVYCRHLHELAEALFRTTTNRILLIIDDENGKLASEFGNDETKSVNIQQYFSCFPASLSIMYNGPLNDPEACTNLIVSKRANAVITGNKRRDVNLMALLIELMLKANNSLLAAIQLIERDFPDLGYDYYYNRQSFQDFKLVDSITAKTPEIVLAASKYISERTKKYLTNTTQKTTSKSISKKAAPKKSAAKKKTIQKKSTPKKPTPKKKLPPRKKK